jgi:hypothetical protein
MFETSCDYALVVDDDACGDCGPEATANCAHIVVELAGWYIRIDRGEDPGLARAGTIGRPPGRDPVDLAARVIVDLLETELSQPPRGPRTHVSEGVPAVDNDRLGRLQDRDGVGVKLFERDIHCPRKVLLVILVARKDLNELCPGGHEFTKAVTVDRGGHVYLRPGPRHDPRSFEAVR